MDYTQNFWPEILKKSRELPEPNALGALSVAARLKNLGASQQQLIQIKNAVVHSNELALVEMEAFKEREAEGTTGIGRAQSKVFDQAYFNKKYLIMSPLNAVISELENALLLTISRTEENNEVLYL